MAISPQLPDHSRELIKHRQLTFDVLSDRGNEIAAKFGLRFELPLLNLLFSRVMVLSLFRTTTVR